jgi:hypothetical protein
MAMRRIVFALGPMKAEPTYFPVYHQRESRLAGFTLDANRPPPKRRRPTTRDEMILPVD